MGITNTASTTTVDKFERVWASLSGADRIALLGHDRDTLTVADKIRLAAISRRVRQRARLRTHRTPN